MTVTAMIFEIDPSIMTPDDLRANPVLAKAADDAFATSKSGPRTEIPSSVAYLPYSHFVPLSELSALASSLLPSSAANTSLRDSILARRLSSAPNLGQIEFNFDISNYNPYFVSLPGKKYATMLQMLQYPFSKGSIHIPAMKEGTTTPTTSDDKPVIDPKYYDGPGGQVDLYMMAAAQKLATKICSTKPLSDIILSRAFPASRPYVDVDVDGGEEEEEDFTDWVRDSTITDWHPVGTCAMGPRKDGYVIDGRLKVHGVRALRVADASIMPLQVSAHIQSTVYAIGEKAASMILEDWERR